MERGFTAADLAGRLRASGSTAELVPMGVETPTVAAAAAALGVDPAQIIKSLLFLAGGQPVLVIAAGTAMVDRAALAARFGIGKKQIKLADPAAVLEITGYAVGGVPPAGHRRPLTVLVDRSVGGWDVVYGGGGDDHTLLRITPQELVRLAAADWIELETAGG